MLNILKRIYNIFIVFFEIVIPTISIISIFILFNLQIFYRYILALPIVWGNEACLILYVWAVMSGAAYAWRKKDHIQFTIVYDLISNKKQLYARLISNSIVIIFLGLILYPVTQQLIFMNRVSTSMLKIPYSIVFFPMLISFILIMIHSFTDLLDDIRKLKSDDSDFTETIYQDKYVEFEIEDDMVTAFEELEESGK